MLCKTLIQRGLCTYRGGFIKPYRLHEHICTFQSFFLLIGGGALQSPFVEGVCKAARGFIHTYIRIKTHITLFPYRYGRMPYLYRGDFMKPLGVLHSFCTYKVGFGKPLGALCTHTYTQTHFSLFSYWYYGESFTMPCTKRALHIHRKLCKAPILESLRKAS